MKKVLTIAVSTSLLLACASQPANRIVSGPPAAGAPAQAGAARDYETGKRVYDLHCARCHGRDGTDHTYPFIATLDGIGKHMTLDEILEATWATGFVSPRQFTDDEKRGLAVYVATL
jgi:mono/diheme cytochrome c family protein